MSLLLLSCPSSPVVRYVTFPCENVGSTPLADNFLRKVADRAAEKLKYKYIDLNNTLTKYK
ncbi:hypothetical protein PFMG_00030 [Plasmodium falciparum IGH-CR14]|uniref:Uncharacterized protein n=1 Tax=Plasmodium falciparum IGH-CR14 TaxID=580059 RepID=A0A0L1I3V0_PLAFA|nr:hypothetical protein PFMG_00030 [Plasmodium falciparum IGH-CR14]